MAYSKQDIALLADAAAKKRGVPAWLVKGIIEQESNWNPEAGNSTDGGSTGLMQVHPTNFKAYGVRREDLLDPVKNIQVGVDILAASLAKTKGDIPRALIDYNAGGVRLNKFDAGKAFANGAKLTTTTEAYIPEVLLRGSKYGGPSVTADEYATIRDLYGSSQTADKDIFHRTGVTVQGQGTASPRLAFNDTRNPATRAPRGGTAEPVIPVNIVQNSDFVNQSSLQKSDFVNQLSSNIPDPIEQYAKQALDPYALAPIPPPPTAKENAKALAMAFGGEELPVASEEYPDWLRGIVKDHATYG